MDNDYAVVVGLQTYPGYDDPANGKPPLTGPENDANDFYEWLKSIDGGAVPDTNISCILSSKYAPAPGNDYWLAAPSDADVIKAFEKLRRRSLANQGRGLGSNIGRRLYIYMSGHGIAPNTFGNKLEKEAALLMCNVDPTNIGAARYHIPGGYTANWFCENDCFEEVFLFMDCCRDPTIVNSINMFFTAKGNKDDTTRFYAFSTGWSRSSRERMFNGRMQGVFTQTLLQGLKGASAVSENGDPVNGVITVASLSSFLYNNLQKKIDPDFQEPDIDYYPKTNLGNDIVIKKAALGNFPVVISIPDNAIGNIVIVDGEYKEVKNQPVVDPPMVLHFSLPKGVYLVTGIVALQSKSVRFDVLGTETITNPVNVSL
jgi:hypothetical protein